MGWLVQRLLAEGINAYGIDVAVAPAACASQLAPHRFQAGSILALPYCGESFDTVVTTDCLEHLEEVDVPQALAELLRVTRRFVFVRLATTPAREGNWHLTVQSREWWEMRFFEAGFRKHPLSQAVIPYESLEREGHQITLLFEKIPSDAWERYPLRALKLDRDLHMDMLRESGRRSDAHIARYHLAKDYIRPNDVVLDLACGLGYGAAILWDGSEAAQVIGMDNSASAVNYAAANFCPRRDSLEFRLGDADDLSAFADMSVDVVVSFETVEHLPTPDRLLREMSRILKPGGRFICSVPNQWADESGQDPNPHHYQVFDLSKLKALVGQHLLIEQVFAQVAGGGMKLTHHPRRLVEVSSDAAVGDQAGWLPRPGAYRQGRAAPTR